MPKSNVAFYSYHIDRRHLFFHPLAFPWPCKCLGNYKYKLCVRSNSSFVNLFIPWAYVYEVYILYIMTNQQYLHIDSILPSLNTSYIFILTTGTDLQNEALPVFFMPKSNVAFYSYHIDRRHLFFHPLAFPWPCKCLGNYKYQTVC